MSGIGLSDESLYAFEPGPDDGWTEKMREMYEFLGNLPKILESAYTSVYRKAITAAESNGKETMKRYIRELDLLHCVIHGKPLPYGKKKEIIGHLPAFRKT